MTTSFSQERQAAARASSTTTPQMGYGQHGKIVLGDDDDDDDIVMCCAASPGPVARLHLDTDPYDSPLPSQRSTLRRDSHILAEISELESNFASQEQVNTLDSQDSQDSQDSLDLADIMETFDTALADIENVLNTSETVAETTDTAPVVNVNTETSEPTERGATRNIELLKLFDDAEQSFNLRFDQSLFCFNLTSLVSGPGHYMSFLFICPVLLILGLSNV